MEGVVSLARRPHKMRSLFPGDASNETTPPTNAMKFLLACLFVLPLSLFAQPTELAPATSQQLRMQEDTLRELSYIMHTDSSADNRFAACKRLIKGLVDALKTPNSYQFPFDSLPGVVVKESPDHSFRIFSWELHVDADNYRHYGAIQRNSPTLQLTPLIDRGDRIMKNPEYATLSAEDWLGYVVYDLVPAGRYEGHPMYFVFGFDRYAKFQRQKVLDVMYFDATGKPVFGAPVFETYNEENLLVPDRQRIILQYGAEASAVLRYERSSNRVVYENLIMTPGDGASGPVQMPDGSYRALELTDRGIWRQIDKVYDHKYEEAPREAGKAPAGQDLFGRRN